MKTALLSGINGQAASYLAELLLEKGYKVIGFHRRVGHRNYENIKDILNDIIIEDGDLTDACSINRLVKQYKPSEFYNLAAQSFVAASWDQPVATASINTLGVVNCLEAIRLNSPRTKFLQMSTSEVYGDVLIDTQNEETETRPRSPYGASKLAAEPFVKVYKDSYNLFACWARAFNYESKRRGRQFVTRKITSWIGEAYAKAADLHRQNSNFTVDKMFENALRHKIISPLALGNLDARRDWSHCSDVVEGIWLMLQQDKPDNYVLASGQTRSIRDFLSAAFNCIGVSDWSDYVVIDPKFYRPAEVNVLCGDYTKAKEKLGWEPKIPFDDMVKEMVYNDMGKFKLCPDLVLPELV